MIKREPASYTRRAANIIWNAAGRDGFRPPFLAFHPNGRPDTYFNIIIGLAEKWIGLDRLSSFFARYRRAADADTYDDLLWLGIENCVYEKELPSRPILLRLRKQRAEEFFRQHQELSEQQMMLQSMTVYSQQEARWAEVTGRRMPLLSKREKAMAQALRFPGTLDADRLTEAMEAFLTGFFRLKLSGTGADAELSEGRTAGLAARFFSRRRRAAERLVSRNGAGIRTDRDVILKAEAGSAISASELKKAKEKTEEEFGPCIISPEELRRLEETLCTGNDAGCGLWVSSGIRSAEADAQEKKNRAYFSRESLLIREGIRSLSAEIETVLSSCMKHLPDEARAGRLEPEKAWRMPVLGDTKVFLREGEDTEKEILADLILDASQSGMHTQEILSAEAYMISESLRRIGIPVRVTAFRSLRGVTVLERLKDYGEAGAGRITRFFSGGWNRDALALKAVGAMIPNDGKKHFLFCLTDANPNDSAPLPPKNGHGRPRAYEGPETVADAAAAVKSLRENGIRTGAVFYGSTLHLENVHLIYGSLYERIRKPAQLSGGVSALLQRMLREIRED